MYRARHGGLRLALPHSAPLAGHYRLRIVFLTRLLSFYSWVGNHATDCHRVNLGGISVYGNVWIFLVGKIGAIR